jgi:hypothetical protein
MCGNADRERAGIVCAGVSVWIVAAAAAVVVRVVVVVVVAVVGIAKMPVAVAVWASGSVRGW